MKTILKTVLMPVAAILPAAALAQNVPAAVVAVVDTQRIYSTCTACVAANTQLQGQITALQTRAQTLSTPLQTEGQAIQTEVARVQALPAGAPRTAAETALRTRVQSFETRQQQAQQELQRSEQNIQSIRANVVRQINERLNPIVTQVMTARGANIAVDQQATLAAARSVDVTDQVLTTLNQQLPSVSLTPLPQQAAPARPGTPAPTPRPQGR